MRKNVHQVIRKSNTFKIGEIVLAKMRGYAAWPAKVILQILRYIVL